MSGVAVVAMALSGVAVVDVIAWCCCGERGMPGVAVVLLW